MPEYADKTVKNKTGLITQRVMQKQRVRRSAFILRDYRPQSLQRQLAQTSSTNTARNTPLNPSRHLQDNQPQSNLTVQWHAAADDTMSHTTKSRTTANPDSALKNHGIVNDNHTVQLAALNNSTKPSHSLSYRPVVQRVDWGWWGNAAKTLLTATAGAVGAVGGAVTGTIKGAYKGYQAGDNLFTSAGKGLLEGAKEGYERPGSAVGALAGGLAGHTLGTASAVVGGLGGAATGLYKTGTLKGTLAGGVAGATAGYVAPTLAGAAAGGYLGAKVNNRLQPAVPWEMYINPKDFAQARKLPYPGRMYDRDKSPGYKKNMEYAIREVLSRKNLGKKVDYDEYVRLHDLVTERLRGDGVRYTTTRASIRTPSSADAATSFPISDWDDEAHMPAEDLMRETIDGMPMVRLFERGTKLRNSDNSPENRSVTLFDSMQGGGDDSFRVRYSEEEGIGYVKSILARYYHEVGGAEDPDTKLSAIVKAIRALHVTHPFKDANGRLHMNIMLNKFLLEQSFNPTILPEQGLNKCFEFLPT